MRRSDAAPTGVNTKSPKRGGAMERTTKRPAQKSRRAGIRLMEHVILDGELGTYAIDRIVEEFRTAGIFRDDRDLIDEARIGMMLVNFCAVSEANNRLQRIPKCRMMSKRFFEGLKQISYLIERNRGLDPWLAEIFAIMMRGVHELGGPTRQLQSTLESANVEIKNYLKASRLEKNNERNRDPLSYAFLFEGYEVWCDLKYGKDSVRPRLSAQDYRHFVRFLAAAWETLRFPTTDHRGHTREPLEGWIADRLRKDDRFRILSDDDLIEIPRKANRLSSEIKR
jgi:hypothetical protein